MWRRMPENDLPISWSHAPLERPTHRTSAAAPSGTLQPVRLGTARPPLAPTRAFCRAAASYRRAASAVGSGRGRFDQSGRLEFQDGSCGNPAVGAIPAAERRGCPRTANRLVLGARRGGKPACRMPAFSSRLQPHCKRMVHPTRPVPRQPLVDCACGNRPTKDEGAHPPRISLGTLRRPQRPLRPAVLQVLSAPPESGTLTIRS